MNTKELSKRKGRILKSIYGSSVGVSLTALAVAGALEIFMFIYTLFFPVFFGPYIWRYRCFYLFLLTVVVVAFFLNLYAKRDLPNRFKILNVASPVCAVLFFVWSIAVTYSDYTVTGVVDPSVFMTFSLIVPLSVFLFPSFYAVIVVAANAVMFFLAVTAGSGIGQLINTVIFFIFQIVLGISFLRLKVKLAERIIEEEDNADIDVMTGFSNRRVYEEDLKALSASAPDGLTYIAIDLNGLKEINDNYGHDTGDKVIIGAARCIEKCFGGKGKTYRIGGDEYAAVLTPAQDDCGALLQSFEDCMRDWSNANGITLTASFGCVSTSELPGKDIYELAKKADAKMYAAKELYYRANGKEGRRYMPKADE